MNKREIEAQIVTDFRGNLSYGKYLHLERLLDAQHPVSTPAHHDEMLFIIQHQTSELWMKLVLHELKAAITAISHDRLEPCFKILARVKQVQAQLTSQWSVLETLTPSEYAQFRSALGPASGFQSAQYRAIEFLLGNKNAESIKVFEQHPEHHQPLLELLHAPSIYDAFLRLLARRDYAIPARCVERDWSQPYERDPEVVAVFKAIYEDPDTHWDVYEMCEKLVDVEVAFHIWRFRHMKTVERTIGFKRGTGGSSGASFLRKALDLTFFPELFDVRTEIGR
ncbi:MAG: tryptophan 2,3-dioxygenase [Proteobacteria bacterium]|nr:tryptophan 2,3-dioxygenase [Pseudomonadota bacterium]